MEQLVAETAETILHDGFGLMVCGPGNLWVPAEKKLWLPRLQARASELGLEINDRELWRQFKATKAATKTNFDRHDSIAVRVPSFGDEAASYELYNIKTGQKRPLRPEDHYSLSMPQPVGDDEEDGDEEDEPGKMVEINPSQGFVGLKTAVALESIGITVLGL